MLPKCSVDHVQCCPLNFKEKRTFLVLFRIYFVFFLFSLQAENPTRVCINEHKQEHT